MSRKRMWMLWVGAALLATAAWGAGDTPPGSPPFGLDFASATGGQQYTGFVSAVFRDYDEPFSPRFDAVVRLRKGNADHAFYAEYDCADTADPCDICFDFTPQDPTDVDLMDVGNAVAIQLCLQDLIEPEVISDFGLGSGVDVRLKDVGGFVSETDPPGTLNVRRVVAADVEVTVK